MHPVFIQSGIAVFRDICLGNLCISICSWFSYALRCRSYDSVISGQGSSQRRVGRLICYDTFTALAKIRINRDLSSSSLAILDKLDR